MLAVLTGPVRSGKSQAAIDLALGTGRPVLLAVGASADDAEMERRIERHRADRPASVTVLETPGRTGWIDDVPAEACLVVDCLGTVLGGPLAALAGDLGDVCDDAEVERRAETIADDLIARLIAREGPTVVVTNEVGWGIVPVSPLGRLFRDVLARANRRLIQAADGAWLVVSGCFIDMQGLPREASWPQK